MVSCASIPIFKTEHQDYALLDHHGSYSLISCPQWSVSGGASTNPCAEDFKGTSQADAPETQALSSYIKSIKSAQGLKLFIDYHSYSQLFMTREYTLSNLIPSDG
jgi:hypothetical protein